MIDIGANLSNSVFKADLEEVLTRASSAGLKHIIITGTNVEESHNALQLCNQYQDFIPSLNLSSTAGVHPHDAKDLINTWIESLEHLHQNKFVKAVGETGLDFNRNYSPRDKQISAFREQLFLASKLEKPVFVHDRETGGETLRILREFENKLVAVVIHCFTGTKDELLAYLDAGFFIGITGWVCDERRGKQLQQIVPLIPDARLMIETDAPWLMPKKTTLKPAKKNRCEPAHLLDITKKIAQLRNQCPEEVRHYTAKNAENFFNL